MARDEPTYISEDEENIRLVGVGDPHLGAVKDPMVTILLCPSLQGERI